MSKKIFFDRELDHSLTNHYFCHPPFGDLIYFIEVLLQLSNRLFFNFYTYGLFFQIFRLKMSKFYMDFYFTYYSGILFPFFFLLASFLLFNWFLFFFSIRFYSFILLASFLYYWFQFYWVQFYPFQLHYFNFIGFFTLFWIQFAVNVSDFFQYFCFIHT